MEQEKNIFDLYDIVNVIYHKSVWPWSPKWVRWRMPLSKGAHQKHRNRVIQRIPSYCLKPPATSESGAHIMIAMYPKQLPWN